MDNVAIRGRIGLAGQTSCVRVVTLE